MLTKLLCVAVFSSCFLISTYECTHFFGGSISGKFIADQGTAVLYQYQIRFGWRRNYFSTLCTDAIITAGTIFLGGGDLDCLSNCLSSTICSTLGYCIGFSSVDNWSYAEIIYNVTIKKNAKYVESSYTGNAWISLNNPSSSNGYWEVRSRIDTTYRADISSYNSCPATIMPPVLKLRLGIRQDFSIPYTDENNDNVRCRYALASKGECADICATVSAVTLNVTACRIYFDGSIASVLPNNGWYAIPLMIEDFISPISTTPLCSVPLQFMIQVQTSSSTCMTPPFFVGDWPGGSCIAANMNQVLNLRMVAQVGCTGNSIYTIQILGPSVTLSTSLIAVTGSTIQWSSNLTWTPKQSQYGPNLVCGLATDNSYLVSNLNCYTILAGITIPYLIRGSGNPSGVLTTTQQAGNNGFITWSIKFNINPVLRPTKNTYVRLFYANGTQIFKMDASIFPSITYVNDTMYIVTGNNFVAGSYYWTFGYGVGTGPEYCRPETDIITDPTFWTFTWVGPTTTVLSTQTFPPGGTVGTSGASSTVIQILPIGVTTKSTTTAASTLATTTASGATTVSNTASIANTGNTTTGVTVILTTNIISGQSSANNNNNNAQINYCKTSLSSFPSSTNCTIQSISLIFTIFLSVTLVTHVGTLTTFFFMMTKKDRLFYNIEGSK